MNAKLLIVTDLGHFKAYRFEPRTDGSPRFHLLDEVVLEPAHQRVVDQTTDLAGRRAAPGAMTGGATLADKHNLELENRRRLVKQIAARTEALMQGHDPAICWLAANKEIINPVCEALPQNLRQRIEKRLARDLTKLEPKEILRHFVEA